jgi:tetratricopeptide (TPR) repeat protein
MKCKHCDSPASDTARFCENCGSALRGEDYARQLSEAYRVELSGQLDEAVTEYERLLHDAPEGAESAAISKHLANLHFRLGHLRRARGHLVTACELDERNPSLWHDLGVIDYHLAHFVGAVASLERALKLDENSLLALFWLGNALYHLGDFDKAADAFGKLIERYPSFTIARFHLGVIYARQGEKEKAEEEFRRVLMKNPEDAAARFYVSR